MRNAYKQHQQVFDFFAGTGGLRANPKTNRQKNWDSFSARKLLEEWGKSHEDQWVQELAKRAFDHQDIDAMNTLVLEYDWFLKRMEETSQSS